MDSNTDFCIVLHIIEGIHLNINNNDLILIANLNGVKFEINAHNTETSTIFNSNCIWECKYDDLKRMKTDNRPIKVECFQKTTRNNSDVKKAIGFILLPIRTLPVVKTPKNLQIKLHWHKFCGLADEWRQTKPELYLSAIITTKELIETEKLEDFLNPNPIENSDLINFQLTERIDSKACGDLSDNFEHFKLSPAKVTKPKPSQTETQSVSHRINVEQQNSSKISRSNAGVSYKLQPTTSSEHDNKAYDIISELEDWKTKQMYYFTLELKRKEILHLNQLSDEWERQRIALAKELTAKLDECNRMTEVLEITQAKYLKNELALEKTKCELDKKYTIKFLESEEKVRKIQDEMDHRQKLHDLQYKQLLDKNNMKSEECLKMQQKIKELEAEIRDLRKNSIPKEQFLGLLDDLKQQSERFYEIEKSKDFYKQQWAKATKEARVLRLKSLKCQKEKLNHTEIFGLDNVMDLRNLIFEECSELVADRSELKNIKDVLKSDYELNDDS